METYLIWSNEHQAWWGPDRCGYVQAMSKAGHYTRIEALEICCRAVPGTSAQLGMLPELPIRLLDAREIVEAPHVPAELF